MFLDVLGTLKSLGFEGFETSFRNVQGQYADAAAARARLEQTGLAFFGVHIFLSEYDPRTRIAPMDLVKATADGAAALGRAARHPERRRPRQGRQGPRRGPRAEGRRPP